MVLNICRIIFKKERKFLIAENIDRRTKESALSLKSAGNKKISLWNLNTY
jgi:hypothetical protein